MNIADMSGYGKDHCELVGGSELSASTMTTTLSLSLFGIKKLHVVVFIIVIYTMSI